jgi:hypothetical protein
MRLASKTAAVRRLLVFKCPRSNISLRGGTESAATSDAEFLCLHARGARECHACEVINAAREIADLTGHFPFSVPVLSIFLLAAINLIVGQPENLSNRASSNQAARQGSRPGDVAVGSLSERSLTDNVGEGMSLWATGADSNRPSFL